MTIAIEIGTTSWRDATGTGLNTNEVAFSGIGRPTETMIWGADFQNLREPNTDELLAIAKQGRINFLKSACTSAIQSGFSSNALGAAYIYDSALPQDQINITGAKLSGIDMMFTCTDVNGVKTERFHTASQIATMFTDARAWIQTNKSHLYARIAAVQTATTVSDVNLVVW